MKSIKGTLTEQNLLKAFAGESQARSRYTFFASVAKKEGYEQIAGVFMETAEQEREHAKRFFKFLEGGDATITASYPAGKISTTSPRTRKVPRTKLISLRSYWISTSRSSTCSRSTAIPGRSEMLIL